MTDHDVPPDTIVRTALQLLPIPAHEDEFWARLERSLDAASTRAAPADGRSVVVAASDPVVNGRSAPRGDASPSDPVILELEHDPALALVPRTLRRTSNLLLVAVAAAAVVVVAIAGNTLLEERNGTSGLTAGDDEASATLDHFVDDAQPDSVTPSTLSPDNEDATSEAVLAWVDDLGAGDGDGAWQAMGATSQAHFGSQAAFEEELTSLAEGYGAWSAAEPDEVLVTPILASDEGTIAVVTLVGTVEQEGSSQHRADAFPVRLVDGDAVLEPFAFAGELEVVVPEGVPSEGVRPPVVAGDALVIVVPSDAEAPVLRLDDGETMVCGVAEGTELTELDSAPGQRCSYLPPDGMDSGEHLLTVAFMGADGASVSAASLLFDAA